MDAESLEVLKQQAAAAEGLPERFAHRLVGSTFSELKADARKAVVDFGVSPPQPRTPGGRFASFSDQIRSAAGRAPAEPVEPPVGDLGLGRGAAAVPRQPQPATMSQQIRASVDALRGHVSLDELLHG